MNTSSPPRHPVVIVETTAFEQKVPKFLGPPERRALQLLLADDPVRAMPLEDMPALLRLAYAGCVVFYVVSPNLSKVYLLDIEKDGGESPPPSKEDLQVLRKVLQAATQGAIIVGVKKGIKWLWDYFKDESLPMH